MGGRGRYRPYVPSTPTVARIYVKQRDVSGPWFIELVEPNGQPGGLLTDLGSEPMRCMARERAIAASAAHPDRPGVSVSNPLHWGVTNPMPDLDFS